MNKFDKILVALDNSDIDRELILAASMASKLSSSTEVHFLYVIKEINMPSEVLKEFPNLISDSLKDRQTEIQRKVDQFFSNENTKVSVEIKSGQKTKTILTYSLKTDVDLIILGRKNEKKSGNVILNRITRRAACSMLIIPKDFSQNIGKVLVPIDFSDNSLLSINHTIDLVSKSEFPLEIIPQHVYQVPSGYHYTGKSFKEFAEIMEKNIEKDYEKFSKRFIPNDLKINPIYSLDRLDSIIGKVHETAEKIQAGAIVISAKGRTSTAALLLGSKTEKIIHLKSDIPLIIIRPKGEKEGLIDMLRKL